MSTKQKKKTHPIIKYLFTSMLILTSIVVGLFIFIGVFPKSYLGIFIGLFVFVVSIFTILLFSKKIALKILGSCLTTVYIILMIILTVYELNTIEFLKKIGDSEYKTYNFNVISLTKNDLSKSDFKKSKLAILDDYESDVYDKIIKKTSNNLIKYESNNKQINDFENNKIPFIIIEDSIYNIMEEENKDLIKKTEIIDSFSIDVTQKISKDKTDITNKPFNIYLTGIDTYGKINSVSRSDVNILITVIPNEDKIILTSIPRDYYVYMPDKKDYDKLTHTGIYGIDTSIKSISNLLDVDINYYIKLNFTSVVKIIDVIGDIEVNSEYSFKSHDGITFKKGINILDGKKTLSFVRERKNIPTGDKARGKNQQEVISAIISKLTSGEILLKYNDILDKINDSFVTNLSQYEIKKFIKMHLNENKKWNIEFVNLDGSDAYKYTYSYDNKKLYVMIPDEELINNVKEKLNKYTK